MQLSYRVREEVFEVADAGGVFEEGGGCGEDSFVEVGSVMLVGSDAQGELDVMRRVAGDAVVEVHLAVQGIRDAAAEVGRGEGNDWRTERERFVAGVSAAEVDGIEQDVAGGAE